jgi:hypothetical protein
MVTGVSGVPEVPESVRGRYLGPSPNVTTAALTQRGDRGGEFLDGVAEQLDPLDGCSCARASTAAIGSRGRRAQVALRSRTGLRSWLQPECGL